MAKVAQKVQRLGGEAPTISHPRAPDTSRTVLVYMCRCVPTGKTYVGSNLAHNSRIKDHIKSLFKGTHGNQYFQNAWNKYGAENFEWVIVEVCDEHTRRAREQWWITSLRSNEAEFGFNLTHPVRGLVPSQRASELRSQEWTPERKAEWSKFATKQMTERWQDPEQKAIFLAGLEKAVAVAAKNEEKNARASERMTNWKNDPVLHNMRQENLKKGRTPEVWAGATERRAKAAERGKETMDRLWDIPAYQEQRAAETAAQWQNPEVRAKMIASMSKPETKAKIVAASRRANEKRRLDALARRQAAGKDIV